MKYRYSNLYRLNPTVTPHAGVWIEIPPAAFELVKIAVTPHAGVWIEIPPACPARKRVKRHPPRGGVD